MWAITTFFNPTGFKTKRENYTIFRESSKKQGLNLIAVELSYSDRFELSNQTDAEILVQLKADPQESIMWQRERLLNIGLKYLPNECTKVCWIDCDLIFENDDWVQQTEKLLDEYPVVQPFSEITLMPQGIKDPKELNAITINPLRQGAGMASCFVKTGNKHYLTRSGYVWAIQRKIIEQIGFYDRSIIGGGDRVWCQALFYPDLTNFNNELHSPHHSEDMKNYISKFYPFINGKISFTEGRIYHLWHGDPQNRKYRERNQILKKYDYHPNRDLELTTAGIWKWSKSVHPDLIQEMITYFTPCFTNIETIPSLRFL